MAVWMSSEMGYLMRVAISGRIRFSALATPCRSSLTARTPMLRSCSEPMGCSRGLSMGLPIQKALILDGNHLTHFRVMYIKCAIMSGWYFFLENPMGSLLWWQDSARVAMNMKGVICTKLRMRSYGALWIKPTCIMHNLLTYHLLDRKVDPDLPVVPLRGRMWFQGALQFPISLTWHPHTT